MLLQVTAGTDELTVSQCCPCGGTWCSACCSYIAGFDIIYTHECFQIRMCVVYRGP